MQWHSDWHIRQQDEPNVIVKFLQYMTFWKQEVFYIL